ncbi:MAG: glycoside hydrolase family 15 protein [Sulfobacillus sp.]
MALAFLPLTRLDGFIPIEDYGLIGNLETCALVGRDGSIDWCCLPYLDSPSVFAAMLDRQKGGRFVVQPAAEFTSRQQYSADTNVLVTEFRTAGGEAVLTDFMPVMAGSAEDQPVPWDHRAILREVECQRGEMQMRWECSPQPDYGRGQVAWTRQAGGLVAETGSQGPLFLQLPGDADLTNGQASGSFTLRAGESAWLVLRYQDPTPLSAAACQQLLEDTKDLWGSWVHSCEGPGCAFAGPWHDQVVRSELVLKLLTHPETGAIAAAATTSLPEAVGAGRNWDYRFAWIRDASFTAQALFHIGHQKEARQYFRWIRSIWTRDTNPADIQTMYSLAGGTDLTEFQLDHLSGYRNSRPVRIGNLAASQHQLDIYGELINALYEFTRYSKNGGMPERALVEAEWPMIQRITEYVAGCWQEPDSGIWEMRGQEQHFTYSKLMCWVALDRSVRLAERWQLQAPLEAWKQQRRKVRRAILDQSFNPGLNSFTQAFGSTVLDASSLLIPVMGLLAHSDPRVVGTIDATMSKLMSHGLVHRYLDDDGLSGHEGAFLLCTFWLVSALALAGRQEEAESVFRGILDRMGPLGLLAEEMHPELGSMLGNYPQAFSHIGLINSALYLGHKRRVSIPGPVPLGAEPVV